MAKPYIVKFISSHSGIGKTSVASHIVSKLKSRGYVICVVKHCVHGVDIEDKDTHRYIASGADIVIASSKSLGIVYHRVWLDSLDKILDLVFAPIIVAEGFRGSKLGDTVVVAENLYEAQYTECESNVIAYVVKDIDIDRNPEDMSIPVLSFSDLDRLVDIVEERAIDHIHGQLPKNNCGQCGFSSCRDLAIAFAKGLARHCATELDVKLVVDGRNVSLNPFVKRLVKSVALGIVDVLKDVPRHRRKIIIEIND